MNSLFAKRAIGKLLSNGSGSGNRSVILIYHAIGTGSLSVTTDDFSRQIEWLNAHARIVSLDEICQAPEDGAKPSVCITFDDGYASVVDEALPRLKLHNSIAVVFLTTGMMGDASRLLSDSSSGHYPNEKFMTWSDVGHLACAGWTIGGHGVNHVDLTRLQDREVERQVVQSRIDIEAKLGDRCRHFAYPWGRNSENVRLAVKQAGYASAVAGIHGPVRPQSDRFALPRIDIRADYSLTDFIAVVTGAWDFLAYPQIIREHLR